MVLGLPCWVIPALWLRKWYNTMLPSGETAIKQDHLPLFEVLELEPKFFQDPRAALHTACKPANPTIFIQLVNQQQQLVDLILILGFGLHVVEPFWGA